MCLEESGVAEYPDGTEKTWTKAFRRCHSWTVTANGATPYTGAHAASLRRFLLSPPAPPWAACLVAPTNGRQLLYLTPLNIDPVAWSVLVEGERVAYTRDSLRRRLGLTLGLASCGGLPSLDGPPKVALASAVILAHGERGESWLAEWSRVHSEPLSRLAIYLTPKREDCARVISTLGSAAGGD